LEEESAKNTRAVASSVASVITSTVAAAQPAQTDPNSHLAAAATQAAVLPAPVIKQRFSLPNSIEKLVAFLTPPVLDPNIIAMEQCRVVRTRLWEVLRARKVKSLLITSAVPSEGKTVLSINMAFALSQLEGVRVLLVDADLRKPSVAEFLHMEIHQGLGTYLQGGCEFEDICWQISPTLSVCPTLAMAQDSAESLHGSRMQTFLKLAGQAFDIVLLDAAPLLPVADTQVLAPLLDGAVLAIRAHSTPAELVKQSADLLGSKLLGTILNGARRPPQNRYYTNYVGKSGKK
jgi:capsular exopolysaccharide synthesis family protein